MQILYKTITADTQVHVGECYFVGATVSHTGSTMMTVYDEDASTATAARKLMQLNGTDVTIMLPLPGVKCTGIYVDWNAGVGTVYYYL